ncbi:MAG: hypothetical protein AB9873_03755 [Syntrophobacteraceae bacterium]
MRLRIIRADESFKIICGREQLERMKRVIAHNGGVEEIEREEGDAVYLVIRKLPPVKEE